MLLNHKTMKLQEGKIPAENRNTYYYVKLAKDMKEAGKSKEEIRQFFKDEEVDSKLVDNILADIFLKLKEDIKNKTYAVYELRFGQPYKFYNEEQDKFIPDEPTKATLYTKEEAEIVRRKLLKPRVDYYQRTGNNYTEIHVGNLFEKEILKEKDDFLKVRETLTRIGVASKKDKTLYQSCHILHKRGQYYVHQT